MLDRIETYNPSLKFRFKKNLEHFKRYFYVSLTCAGFLLLLLFILTSIFKFYYLSSFVLSYTLTITLSFILNKKFTFNNFNPKTLKNQYIEFSVVGILSFLINLLLLYILVDIVGIFYLFSQIIIGIFGIPTLFVIHKKLVFGHRQTLKYPPSLRFYGWRRFWKRDR